MLSNLCILIALGWSSLLSYPAFRPRSFQLPRCRVKSEQSHPANVVHIRRCSIVNRSHSMNLILMVCQKLTCFRGAKKVNKWLKLLSTKFWRRFSQLDGWLIQGLEKLDTPPLSVIHGFITPSTLDIRRSIVIYPNRNPRRRNSKPTHQNILPPGAVSPVVTKKQRRWQSPEQQQFQRRCGTTLFLGWWLLHKWMGIMGIIRKKCVITPIITKGYSYMTYSIFCCITMGVYRWITKQDIIGIYRMANWNTSVFLIYTLFGCVCVWTWGFHHGYFLGT